jgi:hypothetical protein
MFPDICIITEHKYKHKHKFQSRLILSSGENTKPNNILVN